MNKIIINEDSVINIADNIVELDIQVAELSINISGKVIINEPTTHSNKVKINLTPNSYLIYNRFSLNDLNNQISIIGAENSTIEYNHSLLTNNQSNIKIIYDQCYNGSESVINIKGVAQKLGQITIEADGIIAKDTKNNKYLENIRIYNLTNFKQTIIPNLLIATNDVIAAHNATISTLSNNELFYLQTKGISRKQAENLIVKSFLLNNYDNSNFIEKITNFIQKEVD